MALNTTWTDNAVSIFTVSDYGFLGNLIPIIIIIGISWALSKKPREALYIQFPITLACKIFFPFLNQTIIFVSFTILILSLVGSKSDMFADVKELPKKFRDSVLKKKDE